MPTVILGKVHLKTSVMRMKHAVGSLRSCNQEKSHTKRLNHIGEFLLQTRARVCGVWGGAVGGGRIAGGKSWDWSSKETD